MSTSAVDVTDADALLGSVESFLEEAVDHILPGGRAPRLEVRSDPADLVLGALLRRPTHPRRDAVLANFDARSPAGVAVADAIRKTVAAERDPHEMNLVAAIAASGWTREQGWAALEDIGALTYGVPPRRIDEILSEDAALERREAAPPAGGHRALETATLADEAGERALLALLLGPDPDGVHEVLAAVEETDFFVESHRAVFAQIRTLAEDGRDHGARDVAALLGKGALDELDGLPSCNEAAPDLARRIAALATRRRMAATLLRGGRSLQEADADADEVAAQVGNDLADERRREWSEPRPLVDMAGLPTFPVQTLPPAPRAMVEELSRSTQTSHDMAAALALGVLGSCAQKAHDVEVRSGWLEPLSLFALAIAAPAERKSAIVAELLRPVVRWEADEAQRFAPIIRRAKAEAAVAAEQERVLLAEVRKGKRSEIEIREELESLRLVLDRPLPSPPRVFADDATPEALLSLLAGNGGRIGIASAEGGLFAAIAGRYSDGIPNLDGLLKGHAGDALRIDRKGRPAEHVDRPALSMAIAAQPTVLRDLGGTTWWRGRGLAARFLFALPVSRVGSRTVAPPPVSETTRRAWDRVVHGLLDAPAEIDEAGEIRARVLPFTREAELVLRDFERRLEPRLGPAGDLRSIGDWAGKAAGLAARLAGVLALADGADHAGQPDSVDAAYIVAGVEIVERWGIDHAVAALALSTASGGVHEAELVLNWLRRQARPAFTKRDAFRALQGSFKRAADLDGPLAILEERGWIREVDSPTERAPGRPPSERYRVHPNVSGCFVNSVPLSRGVKADFKREEDLEN